MNNAIVVKNVHKSYRDNNTDIEVLKGISFAVAKGETVAIIGSSGSGKSTLLQIMGGLDAFDSGSIEVAGSDISALNEKQRDRLRNEHLGFVYQFHHLLPEFTALENVAMPLVIRRFDAQKARQMAVEALETVGLGHRIDHLPSQMSGGERQRTAIARAMVTSPTCILADEPTGNLDHDTAMGVFEKLVELARKAGTAVVMVTHDRELAAMCDRTLHLANGIVND